MQSILFQILKNYLDYYFPEEIQAISNSLSSNLQTSFWVFSKSHFVFIFYRIWNQKEKNPYILDNPFLQYFC